MDVIREFAVNLLRLLVYAALIPPLAVLALAAVNQRMRRFLLWIMGPLAVAAVVAYAIFAARKPATLEDWSAALVPLRAGITAALPALLVLAVLGLLAFLFGPALQARLEARRTRAAREAYLRALLGWVEPQVERIRAGMRPLPIIEANARISGAPGSGKTTLLKRLLAEQARRALAEIETAQAIPVTGEDNPAGGAPSEQEVARARELLQAVEVLPEDQAQAARDILAAQAAASAADTAAARAGGTGTGGFALPLWIDLDMLGEDPGAALRECITHPGQIESLLPVKTKDLRWLLEREATAHRLAFFVDGSVQNYGLTGLAGKNPQPANDVAALLEGFNECRFVLAAPQDVKEGSINQLVEQEIFLGPLDEAAIRAAGASAAHAPEKGAEAANTALEWGGVWLWLAQRPATLLRLVRCYEKSGALPGTVRELFRVGAFPAKVPAAHTEQALTGLAREVGRSGLYWQPLQVVENAAKVGEVRAWERAGLVRLAGPEGEVRVSFTHPLLLAYFTALLWFTDRAAAAVTPPLLPAGDALAADDPLVADALVFFNNLESDPEQLAEVLEGLVQQAEAAEYLAGAENSAGSFGRFVAVQCLLSMPESARPAEIVRRVTTRLLEQSAANPSAAADAWALLEGANPVERLALYEQTLAHMEPERAAQTLLVLGQRAPEEVRMMLWDGEDWLSQLAGKVWAEHNPRDAFGLFRELYEIGPRTRRELALDLLNRLPGESTQAYLRTLGRESQPVPAEQQAPAPEQARVETSQEEVPMLPANETEVIAPGEAAESNAFQDNPYTVGRPVTGRMFYGRVDLLQKLHDVVEFGGHLLVNGERRSGKTSLLLQLAAEITRQPGGGAFRAAYIDLQGLPPDAFFETTIRAVIAGLRDPNLSATQDVNRPYTALNFEQDLIEVLDYLEETQGSAARMALLLDNIEAFAAYPPEILDGLRRVVESDGTRGMAVILAGTSPLARWTRPEAPFYGAFPVLDIPRMGADEASALVTGPVRGRFTYAPEAVQAIVEAAQGRPESIQALCQHLTSRLLASGEHQVSLEMALDTVRQRSDPRTALSAQAGALLDGLMDWLEANPGAEKTQVDEKLRRTWEDLGKAMVQQAGRFRRR